MDHTLSGNGVELIIPFSLCVHILMVCRFGACACVSAFAVIPMYLGRPTEQGPFYYKGVHGLRQLSQAGGLQLPVCDALSQVTICDL
jgi:hypothetical protein